MIFVRIHWGISKQGMRRFTPESDHIWELGLPAKSNIKPVAVLLNYGFGLLNIIPSQSLAWQQGATAQHRVLTFCAGYFF